jgi:amino acid transporter
MNLSFQEKSTWVTLILTVLIFGYYFAEAISIFQNESVDNSTIAGLFISAIIFAIIFYSISHIILAVINRKEAEQNEDERDKLIELKGVRLSYYVLVAGVFVTGSSLFMTSSPLILANIIFFFFILGEVIGYVSKLIFYRRGV